MVIEERDLIFAPHAERRFREIYYNYYSIGRLRRLSEHRHFADCNFQDAWTGLRHSFQLCEDSGYGQKLGIAPLAGELFDRQAIGLLNDCRLDNEVLLNCLKNLSVFTNPITGQRMRVNYAALNVEEFGSVYEGLLEYDPRILDVDGRMEFSFVAGDDRASSGSHYTPDELVQPLIKHSLDYVIADRLESGKTSSSNIILSDIILTKPKSGQNDRGQNDSYVRRAEQALLSITVCDVACGSGHILLNAARRIATELAILRTGEDQPSPTAFRAAVRDVIRNCIYGVDLNPLAVELCKVGLWLEAHVPGEPLNFLDHHIKCGNAIVGLASREELQRGIPDEAFKTLPDDDKEVAAELRKQNKEERQGYQSLDFSGRPADDLDALRSDFSSVAKLPENTPEEIRQKQAAYDEFRRGIHLRNLKALADIQVAQFYIPKTPETRRKVTTHDQFRRYLRGENPHPEPTAYAQALAHRKRCFHWFLEFPEIFGDGGFDCIVGNPPYLGGQSLSGTYGHRFCEWVRYEFSPTGLSDLIVFFLRRFPAILMPSRFSAIITTNSVTDGDVRRDGLDQLLSNGVSINFAKTGIKWPGRANLYVSLVSLFTGNWSRKRVLNDRAVQHISAFLEDVEDIGEPHSLGANEERIFQGSIFLGDGFLLTQQEADAYRLSDSSNSDVIFQAINGKEVNNKSDQSPGRWIINFFDWNKERAEKYSSVFERIERLVKPVREANNRKLYRDRWWNFAEARPGLIRKIKNIDECFVACRTTKYLNFSRSPADRVFLDSLYVFTSQCFGEYAALQSSLHEVWARKYSGSLKLDLRYSPTNCFETFAFPLAPTQLIKIGEVYHEHRRQLMLQMDLGLTKTYNLFHDPNLSPEVVEKASKQDADVAAEAYSGLLRLRELHREMDEAVLAAYGWHEPSDDGPPIDLRHDFYEVDYLPENDRVRYTIHPDARREILKRLLLLNHRRHAEEQSRKKEAKASSASSTPKKHSPKKPKPTPVGPTLFDKQTE